MEIFGQKDAFISSQSWHTFEGDDVFPATARGCIVRLAALTLGRPEDMPSDCQFAGKWPLDDANYQMLAKLCERHFAWPALP